MNNFSLWSLPVVFLMMFVVGCGGKSTALEGKVVDGKGQPLANVKVAAKMSQPIKGYEQFETMTGADGSFKFGKLFPTSEYQLLFYSERWTKEKKIKIDSGPEGLTKMFPEPVMIRIMDSKEGVVLDTKTNLMWAGKDNGSDINWATAERYCENYRGAGYKDWRMPTQDELAELAEAIMQTDTIKFTGSWEWASEARGVDAASFFFHFFNGGRTWYPQGRDYGGRVLPVRYGKGETTSTESNQERKNAERFEFLDEVKTRYGLVSIKQGEYLFSSTVYINEKKLPFYEETGRSIVKKWEIGSKDVLLMLENCGGTACPATFFFLIVTKNQVVASDSFGNCSDLPEVSRIKGTILVKFGQMSRDAPAETAQYDNGKVYGMVVVKINGEIVKKPGMLQLETTVF